MLFGSDIAFYIGVYVACLGLLALSILVSLSTRFVEPQEVFLYFTKHCKENTSADRQSACRLPVGSNSLQFGRSIRASVTLLSQRMPFTSSGSE